MSCSRRFSFFPGFLGVVSLCFIGCSDDESVVRYTVPKSDTALDVVGHADPAPATTLLQDPSKATDRMLAAVILRGGQAWFFKVTGPKDVLREESERFTQFVKSVRFADGTGAEPEWDLPEGWQKQAPGKRRSSMRFATLEIPAGEQQLEMSVIPLPVLNSDGDQYVLDNVNRWRGQMRLGPLSREQMSSETTALEVDGLKATVVDIVGQMHSTSMGGAPFASGMGMGALPPNHPAPSRPSAAPSGAQPSLQYETPKDWKVSQGTSMSVAAFEVEDGTRKVQITITPAGGDAFANVNRWCTQIQRAELTRKQFDESIKKMAVGAEQGLYVELFGPKDAILGVIVQAAERTWFLKLKGDPELAKEQREGFAQFVKSLRIQ